MRKISGWYRLLIIFAILWTGGSICFLLHCLGDISSQRIKAEVMWHNAKETSISRQNLLLGGRSLGSLSPKEQEELNYIQSEISDIEKVYELELSMYADNRKVVITLFPLYWFAPIGLLYGTGLAGGLLNRKFHKEK